MNRSIAGPVVITAIGLILALAVADRMDGVDLTMIGWILAGLGLAWGLYTALAGRDGIVTRRTVRRPATEVVEEAPPARRRVVRDEVTEVDEV